MLSLLRRIEADLDVLGKRTLTALALAVGVGASIFAGPVWAPVLIIAGLVAAGAWEWSALVRAEPPVAFRVAYLLLIVVAMAVAWWISEDRGVRLTLWWGAAAWWVIALVWLAQRSVTGETPVPSPLTSADAAAPATSGSEVTGSEVTGSEATASEATESEATGAEPPPGPDAGPRRFPAALVAVAGVVSLVPAWLALSRVHAMTPGPWPLVLVIALVVAADMGAYFTGRLLGRHRLVPRVSPGKTWEGLAGGLVAALVVALVASVAGLPLPAGVVPAALMVALISVLGDLTVSMFKRDAGLKHSGRLLPGHGGVLDRIDSFCSAAPAFALWMSMTTDWL